MERDDDGKLLSSAARCPECGFRWKYLADEQPGKCPRCEYDIHTTAAEEEEYLRENIAKLLMQSTDEELLEYIVGLKHDLYDAQHRVAELESDLRR